MANEVKSGPEAAPQQQSLNTSAARNLATTTKSPPQMQGITSRWLLKLLPWVQVSGGVFRVNRRLSYAVGDGRVTFTSVGSKVHVIPQELAELPFLSGFEDQEVLTAVANQFVQHEYKAGDVVVETGKPINAIYLVAHGKIEQFARGKYGDETVIGVLAEGEHFGYEALPEHEHWHFTGKAITPVTVLTLAHKAFDKILAQSKALREHIEAFKATAKKPQDRHGEAAVAMAAGHEGEHELPGTFVDYEIAPREYHLSVAQTVLRVHSRVADLYNEPMNQTEEQLRLTIEALRERQEHELINNSEIGLLHNADLSQRIHTRSGPPTPDDMDNLLALVWKDPGFFLAHPRTIAAFGHECSRLGVYPERIELNGNKVPAWRGVPILPCSKIPVTDARASSVLLLRTGLEKQGVIGLHQTGIPDEYQPSLSVRFMGINEKAIISYLVSAYYSAAVLVPDALAILEGVELGRSHA
jgi:CRP-like cAMP-binding protein